MEFHKVAVDLNIVGSRGVVTLDGIPLRGVRRVTVDASYDSATIITLELLGDFTLTEIPLDLVDLIVKESDNGEVL